MSSGLVESADSLDVVRAKVLSSRERIERQAAYYFLHLVGPLHGLEPTDENAELVAGIIAGSVALDTLISPVDIPAELIDNALRQAALLGEVALG